MVPRTRTITYGSRSFAVSGPRVRNDLPPLSTTLGQFQSRLNKGGGALCAGNAVALLVFGPVMP